MISDNETILELAVEGLKKLLEVKGPMYRFPPDAIWIFVKENDDIDPLKKPHQAKALLKLGFLSLTGAKTVAISGRRAGSTTNEYRFGPKLVGDQPGHVVDPPTAGAADAKTSQGLSQALLDLGETLDSEGYLISAAELANFLLAMTVSPIVILSGISGTGKSLLPRKFAELTASLFHPIPVQPQWSDNSDLFGYVPTLSPSDYIEGRLVNGLRAAIANEEKLVLVLLDEINLAPVEHYLSDFLSVSESRHRSGKEIVTDPLPLELPVAPKDGEVDSFKDLRSLSLPSNIRLIGTANMDETTKSFSPKMLDRSFAIEFDDPDLLAFPSYAERSEKLSFENLANAVINSENAVNIGEAIHSSRDIFEDVSARLVDIQLLLAPAGIKFGYRTRDAILLYLHFWRQFGLSDVLAANAALDFCILQKVLPKIHGSGERLSDSLEALANYLREGPSEAQLPKAASSEFAGAFERSHGKVARMIELLRVDGSTDFWGV